MKLIELSESPIKHLINILINSQVPDMTNWVNCQLHISKMKLLIKKNIIKPFPETLLKVNNRLDL